MFNSKTQFNSLMASFLVTQLLPGSIFGAYETPDNDPRTLEETDELHHVIFEDHKGRNWSFFWDESGEPPCGYLMAQENEEVGSDEDPSWESDVTDQLAESLVALLLDIREGKV